MKKAGVRVYAHLAAGQGGDELVRRGSELLNQLPGEMLPRFVQVTTAVPIGRTIFSAAGSLISVRVSVVLGAIKRQGAHPCTTAEVLLYSAVIVDLASRDNKGAKYCSPVHFCGLSVPSG